MPKKQPPAGCLIESIDISRTNTRNRGLVSTFTGLTQNYGEMIFVRLLLGAFEAGLFPGMTIVRETFTQLLLLHTRPITKHFNSI